MVLFFAKKSYNAGKFTGETEKSASSEEVMEVGMKSTKNLTLSEILKSLYEILVLVRECISTGARTGRSLGYHLLHPLILRLLVYTMCTCRSKLLTNALQYTRN